jgi:acetyltransferase-like isoleucine patch superfamily enzyme
MVNYFKHPMALVESEEIGEGSRVWAFAHIMKGAKVGQNCNIGDHCFIESGAVVGDNVTIKNGVSVWDKVKIENNVFLGPNVVLTNDLLPRSKKDWVPMETIIREGATIGANATIICGVEIGTYSMVGAGAVVSRSVPPYALVYGNPARIRGYICRCARKLIFKNNKATCTNCNKRYVKKNGVVQYVGEN